jgi:hypothetical protein
MICRRLAAMASARPPATSASPNIRVVDVEELPVLGNCPPNVVVSPIDLEPGNLQDVECRFETVPLDEQVDIDVVGTAWISPEAEGDRPAERIGDLSCIQCGGESHCQGEGILIIKRQDVRNLLNAATVEDGTGSRWASRRSR